MLETMRIYRAKAFHMSSTYRYKVPICKSIHRQFVDLGGDIRLITNLAWNAKYLANFNVALYFARYLIPEIELQEQNNLH